MFDAMNKVYTFKFSKSVFNVLWARGENRSWDKDIISTRCQIGMGICNSYKRFVTR